MVKIFKYVPGGFGGKYKGAAVGPSPTYGPSAQEVELTVNEDTGKGLYVPEGDEEKQRVKEE